MSHGIRRRYILYVLHVVGLSQNVGLTWLWSPHTVTGEERMFNRSTILIQNLLFNLGMVRFSKPISGYVCDLHLGLSTGPWFRSNRTSSDRWLGRFDRNQWRSGGGWKVVDLRSIWVKERKIRTELSQTLLDPCQTWPDLRPTSLNLSRSTPNIVES